MKFLTLQIVKRMGFKDVAITGQYYESSYTPETQVLEWMRYKGEPMDGMVAMFGPGERAAGIKAIRDFGIPNAFLDLTFKAEGSSNQAPALNHDGCAELSWVGAAASDVGRCLRTAFAGACSARTLCWSPLSTRFCSLPGRVY